MVGAPQPEEDQALDTAWCPRNNCWSILRGNQLRCCNTVADVSRSAWSPAGGGSPAALRAKTRLITFAAHVRGPRPLEGQPAGPHAHDARRHRGQQRRPGVVDAGSLDGPSGVLDHRPPLNPPHRRKTPVLLLRAPTQARPLPVASPALRPTRTAGASGSARKSKRLDVPPRYRSFPSRP